MLLCSTSTRMQTGVAGFLGRKRATLLCRIGAGGGDALRRRLFQPPSMCAACARLAWAGPPVSQTCPSEHKRHQTQTSETHGTLQNDASRRCGAHHRPSGGGRLPSTHLPSPQRRRQRSDIVGRRSGEEHVDTCTGLREPSVCAAHASCHARHWPARVP